MKLPSGRIRLEEYQEMFANKARKIFIVLFFLSVLVPL